MHMERIMYIRPIIKQLTQENHGLSPQTAEFEGKRFFPTEYISNFRQY